MELLAVARATGSRAVGRWCLAIACLAAPLGCTDEPPGPTAWQGGATLTALWGSATNDVWAVGEGGTIIHWDGQRWASVASCTDRSLAAIWGATADDVWAVGEQGTILHWDATGWSPVASPTAEDLQTIWISESDGWAFGPWVGLRRLGTEWVSADGYVPAGEAVQVVGERPNEVWLATRDRAPGGSGDHEDVVLRFDGATWNEAYRGGPERFAGLGAISKSPGGSIWVLGTSTERLNMCSTLRWDGLDWMFLPMFGSAGLRGIFARDWNLAWAVGENGAVWSHDGSWNVQRLGPFGEHLNAVWMSAWDDVWIVGADGVILHRNGLDWSYWQQ